jgi:TonB family protein
VLLPVSCFTGLSDVQVEAILCHELAHIRRHDYLVSVAQGVVEAVLFYQPCVWWVSRQVRRERECCCDRMAVGVGGDRLAYARALSALEARRSFYPEIALGANGGVLTMRIRRLLGMKGTEAHSQVASVALLAMIVVAGGAGIGRLAHAQAGAAPAATVVPDGAARVAPIAGMAQDAETGSAKARVRILKDDPEFKKLPDAEQKRVLDSLKQVRPLTDEELKSIAEAQRLAMTVNSAEFAEQMAKMQVEAQRFNTPEFRKRMADMQAEVAKINTPEFQKQMAEQMRALGEAQGALARQKALEELNSDDFKKQMAAMQAEVAKINTPEFRAQMKAMAAEAAKIDTPEFRKQMDESMRSMRDAQKNMARQTAAMKLGPDAQELAELSANLGAMSRLEDGGGDSSAHGPVQVAGGVMAASVVSQAPPVYPPIAKAAHVSGVVVLRALISKVGTVENLQVVSGPQMLRSSAMDAVKMWTYKPYLLNGEPVEVETTVNVNFSFGDEGPAPSGAVRVSGATMQGMLVSQATPVYPADAKEQHIFGAVVLKAVISKEGTIAGLQVVSGPKELMKSAIDAVKQWTYKPYLLNGEPTEVVTTITVNYSFGGDAAVPGAPAIGPHLAGWLDQHRNLPVDQQIKALESEPGFRELSPEAQRRMRDHLVRLNAMAAGDGGGAAFAPKRVGHGVSAPVPVSMPDPEYTPEARKAKVSGDVLVSLWVDENGIPTHVGVLRGMGNGLDEQAVEAVKKYRFKPAMEDGKPVTVAMNVEVNFKIF